MIISSSTLLIVAIGFIGGVVGTAIGNTLPIVVSALQLVLPQASFGSLIGTIKFGGLFKGFGAILKIYPVLDFKIIAWLWPSLALGALVGVNLIAHLDSKWIFPTLIIAYLIAEYASTLAQKISGKSLQIVALAIGVYVTFLGAGLRSIFMALLRVKYPQNDRIAQLKIHCSFLSWSLVPIAVAGHLWHGNIDFAVAIPFAFGAFTGGIIGGHILKSFTIKSPATQKWLMRTSFGIGILVSGYLFFK